MRLFIAVDVPDKVESYIRKLQQQIPRDTGKFSLTSAAQYHITMAFLGEVSKLKLPDVRKSLESIDFDSFKVKTGNLGFFPDSNYIRVFWLGLRESKRMDDLAHKILKALPMAKKDHPFHAHITLARVKHLSDKQKFLKKVESMELEEIEWKVDKFRLMNSVLKQGGAVYEEVEEFCAECE